MEIGLESSGRLQEAGRPPMARSALQPRQSSGHFVGARCGDGQWCAAVVDDKGQPPTVLRGGRKSHDGDKCYGLPTVYFDRSDNRAIIDIHQNEGG